MGDLTKNLSVSEFACDCNYPDCPAKEAAHMPLVLAIQEAVDYFTAKKGARVIAEITDGNRCFKNNVDIQMKWSKKTREEAEKSKSKHLNFIAADHRLKVKTSTGWQIIPPQELFDYYAGKYPNSHGIGIYSNRVHLDTRPYKARW